MCPYFNPSEGECRVMPYDSNALRDDGCKNDHRLNSSGYRTCGNYEAAQRGDYRIVR